MTSEADDAALARATLERMYAEEKNAEEEVATGPTDLDTYFDGLIAVFEWNLDADHLASRRFVFKASALHPEIVAPYYLRWLTESETDLRALGLTEADAVVEARILINVFDGFLYDLVLNGDPEITHAAFLVAMQRYRERLAHLIELSV